MDEIDLYRVLFTAIEIIFQGPHVKIICLFVVGLLWGDITAVNVNVRDVRLLAVVTKVDTLKRKILKCTFFDFD